MKILPLYIARRYLISKKSHNIINIISGISVAGVTVGTMALIVVLSVFNGFEDLVKSLYNTFDPDFKITRIEGKSFLPESVSIERLRSLQGVQTVTEVVEENVLLKHKTEQYIATMKGVSNDFLSQNPLDSMLFDGDMRLQGDGIDYTLMGYLVAYNLGIKLYDPSNPILAYVPKRTKRALVSLEGSFNTGALTASAVFAVQQEIDAAYVIVPVTFARDLMEYENGEMTSLEIRLSEDAEAGNLQEEIEAIVGNDYEVKDRFQQQATLYKIMKTEKWAIFFILTFILIIAAFNVIGSISMLILDKRRDIGVLSGLGASGRLIRRIFLVEGLFVSLFGALAGLALGAVLCWVQIHFGLIRLGDANSFIVEHYPVKMEFLDFIAVFFTVLFIGVLSAWFPVRRITSEYLKERLADMNLKR
jgi:lipoprotein-releasing system permease protein